MKKCVIFCAGGFESLVEPVENAVVIAADGGLRHAEGCGIVPDIVLGDFDSLGYQPAGAEIFPVEKDDTDAMLAVKKGLALGCRKFVIYGGLDGERLDHTVANLQTLQFLADRGAAGTLVGRKQIATVVKDGSICFPARFAGTVSVFCMGADAEGVTISGLQYGLENGRLSAGFPLGVSNHFVGKQACVRVEKGMLLLIWQRENGEL